MIIVLLGYMGSGKSSVGKELSKLLNLKFLDLDEVIVSNTGLSISEIFKAKGEIHFRKLETQTLAQIVASEEKCILSLGGGTPCYGNNMNLLNESTKVTSFYLKLSIQSLADRLIDELDHRPIIKHLTYKDQLTEYIAKHLFERHNFYEQASKMINCDQKLIKEVAAEIVAQLY